MGSLQCSIHKTWKVMKFCGLIFQAWQEPELVQVFQVLEIYTVTSLCMFSILFSINFLRYLQKNLFDIIMYTAICHTVFYTFPKALTGKICLTSLCIFSMLFSIHFLRYLQENLFNIIIYIFAIQFAIHFLKYLQENLFNIIMYILHSVFYTFPKVLTGRICSTIKSCFSFWSFPVYLSPSCLIQR